MMDEQLIDEVAHHSVIYNRQKYYMNGSSGSGSINKYETKDDAWQIIAMKLRSDVDTCKKRWKYLRERYVSQRKQGDPPVYEHLSRPYLEKMKFLDQHIQPRKSYRSMPNYLTSPHSANSSFNGDFNMDTKSNGSIKSMNIGHYPTNNHHYNHVQSQDQSHAIDNGSGHVKIEADQMFRDFAAAVASQQLHQHQVAAVAAAIADSSQNFQENFRDTSGNMNNSNMSTNHNAALPVSSSTIKSSITPGNGIAGLNGNNASVTTPTQNTTQSSPTSTSCTNATATPGFGELNTDDLDSSTGLNYNMKKPRVQLNNNCHNNINNNNNNNHANGSISMNGNNSSSHFNNTTDSDDDSDDKSSSIMPPQPILNENQLAMQRHTSATSSTPNQITSNAEFLFQLYQQLPHSQQQLNTSGFSQQQHPQQQQQQTHYNKYQISASSNTTVERSSEQLLGELVTSELLKMNKDRRKNVQKRILEILFFDD